MKVFRAELCEPIDFVAPAGGVVSGRPLLIGPFVVVPQASASAGAVFAGLIEGKVALTKQSGFVPVAGQPAYFDFVTDNRLEASGTQIGIYAPRDDGAAYVSGDTLANVLIGASVTGRDGRVIFSKGITARDTSTGVTAGTNETEFTNLVTIPAAVGIQAGDRLRVRAKVNCLNQNATDTVALILALAANQAGLAASTCILSSVAAVDAGTNDTWELEFDGYWFAAGAAGGAGAKLCGSGKSWKNGATPAFLGTNVNDDTTVSTLVDIVCGLTYQWSVSNAANQVRLDELYVEVIRPLANA